MTIADLEAEWLAQNEILDYRNWLQAQLLKCRESLPTEFPVHVQDPDLPKHVQTSGPQCKRCGGFTTYKRRDTHGLCMKCELETKK